MATTATRVLDNYIGGAWTPASAAAETLDVDRTRRRRGARPRAALGARRRRRRRRGRPRGAAGVARRQSMIERARQLFALREGLDARREDLARSVTTEMGKTIVDARAEVARMIEMVEARLRDPDDDAGARTSRTSRATSTPRRSASRSACAPRSSRSTSRRWCRSGSCRSRSGAATRSSSSPPSRSRSRSRSPSRCSTGSALPPGVVNLVNGGREVVEGDPRPPGHRRGLVRRLGAGREARLRARREGRQARAGARRREEPHGRDARRGDRQDRRRHHRLGLRRRRPALHGGLGGGHGRRGARARCCRRCVEATEALRVGDGIDERTDVGPVVSCARARPHRAAGSTAAGRRARRRSSTAAAPRATGRRRLRRPDDPRRRHARDGDRRSEEVFGPVLSVVRAETLDEAIDDRQPQPLRQRHVDLHRVRRRRPALPPRRRGGHDRRQHRRRRAGRVLPVLGLEGLASSATCTPTAPTRSSSTPARRRSRAASSRAARARRVLRRALKDRDPGRSRAAPVRGLRAGLAEARSRPRPDRRNCSTD